MGLCLDILPQGGALAGPWHMILDEEFSEGNLNTQLWTPYWFTDGNSMNNVNCYKNNVSLGSDGLELLLAGANNGALVSSNPNTSPVGFQFLYGYVEMQITFPANNDFSAGWLLGQNPTAGNGEFDIAETNIATLLSCGNYHYGANDATAINDPSPVANALGVTHTFGLNWQPGVAQFYLDNVLRPVSIPGGAVVSSPQYLIFNHGATSSADASGAGSNVVVRYVRVWQH